MFQSFENNHFNSNFKSCLKYTKYAAIYNKIDYIYVY